MNVNLLGDWVDGLQQGGFYTFFRQEAAWRAVAPWPDDAQVEQDMILSRAVVELFSIPELKTNWPSEEAPPSTSFLSLSRCAIPTTLILYR